MIIDKLNLAAGAVAGAVVAVGLYSLANTIWLLPAARYEGKKEYIAERAAEDLKAEQERKKADAELQKLSDYDLCVRALGRMSGCDAFLQPVRPK